jgi:hypothetical protein
MPRRKFSPRGMHFPVSTMWDQNVMLIPRPIIALDIDGTLGFYHAHFMRFACDYWAIRHPRESWHGDVPYHKWIGLSKPKYREAKLAYRRGGLKRTMPIMNPFEASFVRTLRGKGAEVWYCTTRPYLSMENIEKDTLFWLRRNGFQHDGLIFGEHKYRNLRDVVGAQNVIGGLDDLPEMVFQGQACGMPIALAKREYNECDLWGSGFYDVQDACGREWFRLIDAYKEKNGLAPSAR